MYMLIPYNVKIPDYTNVSGREKCITCQHPCLQFITQDTQLLGDVNALLIDHKFIICYHEAWLQAQ